MYIEFHDGLRDEIKIHRLAKLLGLSYVATLGHVSCLWIWTAKSCPDNGSLADFTPEEIAHGALWSDEPGRFLDALKKVNLVDENMTVHNWTRYGVRLLLNNRKAVRRFRRKSKSNMTDILL